MKAVFRHELATYFTGLTGYVFGAFLLLFGGIYTMVICLNAGSANFEYVLSNLSFIFLIIVPILTMRVIAEEKRQKTDQLLYSLPLSMTGVTLGKYAAMVVIFLIPTGVLCVYPLLLTAFGSIYLPAVFSTVVGFVFLGAALLAIGMFLSSITESQGVAAGLCFVVLLVCYFLPGPVRLLLHLGLCLLCRVYSGGPADRPDLPADDPEHPRLGHLNGGVGGGPDSGLWVGGRQLRRSFPQFGGGAVPL